MSDYLVLIERKLAYTASDGLSDWAPLPASLFPHQRALTEWALRRGRAAIFADTGLGKSRMEVAWARAVREATGKPVLMLAPLAVAPQTVQEGAVLDIEVNLCRAQEDVCPGINITNYERLHRFDTSAFAGVVLDESSCIKHHDSKTLAQLMEAFRDTPYKLCATATPAPNDWTELGTHAQFLGIRSQAEMLAEFFVHDGGETQVWRLKGHARIPFWRWVASWGALVRTPADLGFDGSAYDLPALELIEHVVRSDDNGLGDLFAKEAQTLSERRAARKSSLSARAEACAAIVNQERAEPWIIWCDLNAESQALTAAIPDAIEVTGADPIEVKEARLLGFLRGQYRVLVSKPSICGFGINAQRCARMAFVGVTDSWEAYYQAVRRCWRFGQTRPVSVHIFASEAEGSVVANLRRKERDAKVMAESLAAETLAAVRDQVLGSSRESNPYNPQQPLRAPRWLSSQPI